MRLSFHRDLDPCKSETEVIAWVAFHRDMDIGACKSEVEVSRRENFTVFTKSEAVVLA